MEFTLQDAESSYIKEARSLGLMRRCVCSDADDECLRYQIALTKADDEDFGGACISFSISGNGEKTRQ